MRLLRLVGILFACMASLMAAPVRVTISPSSPSVSAGGTVEFTATVTNTANTAVSWTKSGGTFTQTGSTWASYTAPATPGTYTVTATSLADSTKKATATVTVTAPVVTVTIDPTSASLFTGGTQQFTANVSNASNTSVTWTASGGVVSSTGFYTAPATAGTYTVTARSDQDTTKSASATVTVTAPPTPISVSVSPAVSVVNFGSSVNLAASVTGTANTAVTWAITGSAGGSSADDLGTISATGLYTAPAAGSTYWTGPRPVFVEARSVADPTKVVRVAVTVQPTPAPGMPSVTVDPPTKTDFVAGEVGAFTGTAAAAPDPRVEWEYLSSLGDPDGSGANDDGTITVLGAFRAQWTASDYGDSAWRLLRATSVANRASYAFLVVRVWRLGAVLITPGSLSTAVKAGTTKTFLAEVKGGGSVTWSLPDPGTGAVSASGVYTAPAPTNGLRNVRLVASNASDPGLSGEVQVPIIETGDVTISGPGRILYPGQTASFSATVEGGGSVTWSVVRIGTEPVGTITSKGVYTAPSMSGTTLSTMNQTIRAANAKTGSTKSAVYLQRVDKVGAPFSSITSLTEHWTDSLHSANTVDTQDGHYENTVQWSISNGFILSSGEPIGSWPFLNYLTDRTGTLTLTAKVTNPAGATATDSNTITVVAVPDFSGVFHDSLNTDLRFLDFGVRRDSAGVPWRRVWVSTSYTGTDYFSIASLQNEQFNFTIKNGTLQSSRFGRFSTDGTQLIGDSPSYSGSKIAGLVVGFEPVGTTLPPSEKLFCAIGSTLALKAVVGGSSNKAVTWTVTPTSGGSVNPSTGVFTPGSVAGDYTLTVTTVATPSASYSRTVQVSPSNPLPVSGVYVGTNTYGGSSLKATFYAQGTKVYGKANLLGSSNPDLRIEGSLNGSRLTGTYVNGLSTGSINLVFAYAGDGSLGFTGTFVNGVSTYSITGGAAPGATGLLILEPEASILSGEDRGYTAVVVGNANTAVQWTLVPTDDTALTISGNQVIFRGPSVATSRTYELWATSQGDIGEKARRLITVRTTQASVTPGTASLAGDGKGTRTFTAAFPSEPSNDADWTVLEGPGGGSVNGRGEYITGPDLGTFTVQASSQWDPALKATAVVTVTEPTPTVSNYQSSVGIVQAGGSVTLSWGAVYAYQTPNPRLTLEVRYNAGGLHTLDVTGLTSYTYQPTGSASYVLIVTSASGKTGSSSLYVSLQGAVYSATLTAFPVAVRYGDPLYLTAHSQLSGGQLWVMPTAGGTAVLVGGVQNEVPFLVPSNLLATQKSFRVTYSDPYGNAVSSAWLAVPVLPRVSSFTATPSGILPGSGGSSTLAWGVDSAGLSGTLSMTAQVAGGSLVPVTIPNANGSIVVTPTQTTTYTLTVNTSAGGDSKAVTVRVADVAALSISPATKTMFTGETATFTATLIAIPSQDGLSWSTTGGTLSTSGTVATYKAPNTPGTHEVRVASVADPAMFAVATVTVTQGAPGGGGEDPTLPQILSFTWADSTTNPAEKVLTWVTANADSLSLTDNRMYGANVTGQTTATVAPTTTTIYTLTATKGAKSVSRSLTIPLGAAFAVAIEPSQVSMFAGDSFRFGYSLYAPSNRVNWTADRGTIAADGTYTAPATGGADVVRVASVDDPNQVSAALVDVQEITLTIQPAYLSMVSGQSYRFGFEVFSKTGEVPTWSASAGTITSDGTFTAPNEAGPVTITLTSSKDATRTATATVDVAPISVVVSPPSLTLGPERQARFLSLTSRGGVIWSVVEPGGGTISNDGLYQAPGLLGTYTVKATSALDSSRYALAQVTVTASGGGPGFDPGGANLSPVNNGVLVDPPHTIMEAGTYQNLTATVQTPDDPAVTWSLTAGTTAGSVDQNGTFYASEPGAYQVTAVSRSNPGVFGTAVLVVHSSLQPTGEMPAGLDVEGFTLTTLKTGKFLITGGQDTRLRETAIDKGYRDTAFLYDPETKVFTPVGAMSVPRAWHTATLLLDGRVLVTGGRGYFRWPTNPEAIPMEQDVRWGEVFNPTTNAFEALPVPPNQPSYPGGYTRSNHAGLPSSATLEGGQVIVVGGSNGVNPAWVDVFDPVTGLFDLSEPIQGIETLQGSVAIGLPDGKALVTGGEKFNAVPGEPSPCGSAWCSHSTARLYDPQMPGTLWAAPNPMLTPRAYHTMTRLHDGRILITGGVTSWTYNEDLSWTPVATATCEIYDPATGSFTATGSMRHPRMYHVAVLLPTGQVLAVGGITIVTPTIGGSTIYYPRVIEIFDPESGGWNDYDVLDHGLDSPKVEVNPDGNILYLGRPITGQASQSANVSETLTETKVGTKILKMGAPEATNNVLNQSKQGQRKTKIEIDFITINQGVERYLDETLQISRVLHRWAKNVPIIKARDGYIQIYFKSKTQTKDKFYISAILIDAENSEIDPSTPGIFTYDPNSTNDFYNHTGNHIRFRYLDLVNSNNTSFKIKFKRVADGKVYYSDAININQVNVPELKIKIASMEYKYQDNAGTNVISKLDFNEVKTLIESECLRLLPISSVSIEEVTQDTFPNSELYNRVMVWDEVNRGKYAYLSNNARTDFHNQWNQLWMQNTANVINPKNLFYLLVRPSIDGHSTAENTPKGWCYPFASHGPAFAISRFSEGLKDYLHVAVHEMGHGFGLYHTAGPTSQFDGFADPLTPNTGPYMLGRIGVWGWGGRSTFNGVEIELNYAPSNTFDLMSYEPVTWAADHWYARVYFHLR